MSANTLSCESIEVIEARAKAEEYGKLAADEKDLKKRAYYERMQVKWAGIADGWRTIDEIAKGSQRR